MDQADRPRHRTRHHATNHGKICEPEPTTNPGNPRSGAISPFPLCATGLTSSDVACAYRQAVVDATCHPKTKGRTPAPPAAACRALDARDLILSSNEPLAEVGLRAGWQMETLDLLARCWGVSTGDVTGSLGAPPPSRVPEPPPEFPDSAALAGLGLLDCTGVVRLLANAEHSHLRWHAWRRMGAAMFIRNGATMQELMSWGRWKYIVVTHRYFAT